MSFVVGGSYYSITVDDEMGVEQTTGFICWTLKAINKNKKHGINGVLVHQHKNYLTKTFSNCTM
jgi:hypothetical protein